MFWQKKQDDVERSLSSIHHLLAKSFTNVKRDTQNIFQWITFLYQKNMEQENRIKQLQTEISYIPRKPEDIKRIVDSYYSFDHVLEKIKALNEKIDNLNIKKPNLAVSELTEIEKRLINLEEQRKATIREKVVKRVTRNSREYVKSLILSYVRKYGQISGLQLYEMIVHEQGLCSKSSFYRLLDELEKVDEIGTARKGKQKYYVYKQIKVH